MRPRNHRRKVELTEQQVLVRWGLTHEAAVPLNVVDGSKAHLPIAPDRGLPSEADIIAYLTGQISWPWLFGASETSDNITRSATDLDRVDTSGIVAYRMRDFVEALPGMPAALTAGAATAGAMRLALVGPASPLALAKHAVEAAKGRAEPRRSVTTAAFQVIELMATVEKTRRFPDLAAGHAEAWRAAVDEALAALTAELGKLRALEPGAFAVGTALARVEAAIRPAPARIISSEAA